MQKPNTEQSAMTRTPEDIDALTAFIEALPDGEKSLYVDDGCWWACTDWLVGGFAGRAQTHCQKHFAVRQMAEYLDAHKGHDSVVGRAVDASGWPNLAAVQRYLTQAAAA